MANVNNLEPYGTWSFKAIVIDNNVSSYKFIEVTGF
jgi:hypothetical protein